MKASQRIFGPFSSPLRKIGFIALLLIVALTIAAIVVGTVRIYAPIGEVTPGGSFTFTTDDLGEYEDELICPVTFETEDGEYELTISYPYEEWEELPEEGFSVTGYVYLYDDGYVAFDHEATDAEIAAAARENAVTENKMLFSIAMAAALFAVALGIMVFFGHHFTTYETVWFLSILVLAAVFSLIFPEDDMNGWNGLWIMALYLLDTLLNILCELLISKQSKWNFIVSVFVELTEIATLLVLANRFATMATTLFFWLPCDIISFINWNKKPDREEEELTRVRTLKGYQEVLILVGIAVWTIVVGYFLSGLDITTDLFGGNKTLATVVCYLDACVSAVGVANGLAILFRFREQWIAWYIDAILEAVINILSGQYVLLVLKAGYLTNTTYGYVKWTKYIKKHPEVLEEKTFF